MTPPAISAKPRPSSATPTSPRHSCNCVWSEWHNHQATAARADVTRLTRSLASADAAIDDLRKELENRPRTAARTHIPALKPGTIHRYIGAVARAVATGQLTAPQGNGLLYAAQTMISVYRTTQVPPTPSRQPAGFKAPEKAKPR